MSENISIVLLLLLLQEKALQVRNAISIWFWQQNLAEENGLSVRVM
jgi:hypothetical protein